MTLPIPCKCVATVHAGASDVIDIPAAPAYTPRRLFTNLVTHMVMFLWVWAGDGNMFSILSKVASRNSWTGWNLWDMH
jgi:hypothetical protein